MQSRSGGVTAVVTVGRLKIPRDLESQVKVGTFNTDFAIRVPDYGDDKGDIVFMLTVLRPVAPHAFKAPSAAAPTQQLANA